MPQRTCTVPGCAKIHRARGLCSTHYNQNRYTRDERHPKSAVGCVVCGTMVTRAPDHRRRPTCSVECRTRVQFGGIADADGYDWGRDAARRAARLGATKVELVSRREILDGDGWSCYLCGVDTRAAASPFDPESATIDHVVPISKGGQHVRENLRCCCLGCNSSKQASLISPGA